MPVVPLPGVRIEQMQVPRHWPEGFFDLILFSEVLYFLDEGDLCETCAHALHSLLPGGYVLLVNYTGKTDDPLSGDTAASFFIEAAAPTLQPIYQICEPHYRLDLLGFRATARCSPASNFRREGDALCRKKR